MGYFNRLLLFLYALAVSFLSLGVAIFCSDFFRAKFSMDELILYRSETVASLAVVFFLSLYFIHYAWKMKKEGNDLGELLTLEGKMGKVKVSLAVFKTLVKTKAITIRGVEDVKVKASLIKANEEKETSKVKVKIFVTLNPHTCATDVGDAIKLATQSELEHFLGTKDFFLEVFVKEISEVKSQNKPSVA